jgi:hypothetical protein
MKDGSTLDGHAGDTVSDFVLCAMLFRHSEPELPVKSE